MSTTSQNATSNHDVTDAFVAELHKLIDEYHGDDVTQQTGSDDVTAKQSKQLTEVEASEKNSEHVGDFVKESSDATDSTAATFVESGSGDTVRETCAHTVDDPGVMSDAEKKDLSGLKGESDEEAVSSKAAKPGCKWSIFEDSRDYKPNWDKILFVVAKQVVIDGKKKSTLQQLKY